MVSVAVAPGGIGEGKVVVVGAAMVMDFLLDDSGATSSSSSSSSLPFLLPISDQLGFSFHFTESPRGPFPLQWRFVSSLSPKNLSSFSRNFH